LITENISTLKIHKLTQEQYERELAAGNLDENALYLTPDDITKENVRQNVIRDFKNVGTFEDDDKMSYNKRYIYTNQLTYL
jgi:hypothetical protein